VKVGILGATGPAGRGLAARLATVGMKVYAGSRDVAKAESTVKHLHERFGERMNRIEPVVNKEAAEAGEVVILATTADATVPTATEYAALLAGKPVISMANAMRRAGAGFEPVTPEGSSIAAGVQKAAPEALVAAALHHVPAAAFMALDKPMVGDVLVVSDSLEALRSTQALVAAMPDLRPLDAGSLVNAIGLEAFCASLLTVNLRYGGKATLRLLPT
jgi:8-hydroxy-5-deazaflavin:NADPH oxidoreductase